MSLGQPSLRSLFSVSCRFGARFSNDLPAFQTEQKVDLACFWPHGGKAKVVQGPPQQRGFGLEDHAETGGDADWVRSAGGLAAEADSTLAADSAPQPKVASGVLPVLCSDLVLLTAR